MISIREVIESDLPIFFEHQLDPGANQMIGSEPRDHAAFMSHWRRNAEDPDVILQTIVVDNVVAGNIVSFQLLGEREIGYWLGRDYWGRGIATRALQLFLQKFAERPLYAHVAKHNHGSLRVLQKCGFEVSGEDSRPAAVPGTVTEEFTCELSS